MLALPVLIHQCVPSAVQPYMSAIVQVESKGNPLAMNLNNGYQLQFQPKSEDQAKKWISALEQKHYNFDVGLAQVNNKNAIKYGYKSTDLLNPCINLKVASDILIQNYKDALVHSKHNSDAMQKAISAYNTGNFRSGFRNGYVHKVYAVAKANITNNRKTTLLALNDSNVYDIPPIVTTDEKLSFKDSNSSSNHNYNSSTDYHSNANNISSHTSDIPANPYNSRSLLYIQQKKVEQIALNEVN